jgi:flagellar basal-body rod protein FlgG
MDVIADNLANVNTAGFKSGRMDFRDALYTAAQVPGGRPYTPEGSQQKGHGVLVSQITKDMRGGSLTETQRSMDFAIEGDAFLQTNAPGGGVRYIKSSPLYTTTDADGGVRLVTALGRYVLDENGEMITIPQGTTDIDSTETGELTFRAGDEVLGSVQLGVYRFINQYGLSYTGETGYGVTEASGEALAADPEEFRIIQGSLEASNVSMAQEMTLLIRAQRTYSLAARMISTADQMEGLANQMRG